MEEQIAEKKFREIQERNKRNHEDIKPERSHTININEKSSFERNNKKLQSENSQILKSNELDNSIKTKEETISSISLIKDEEVTPINPQNRSEERRVGKE